MENQDLKISFDDSDWRRLRGRLKDRAENWRPAAKRIHREMMIRVDSMFGRLKQGGKHRGVTWKYFAPQYTRKTDGITVPAWGGVPRLYGKGRVLGRLRPSGQRIKQGDSVGQDTGNLRRGALLAARIEDHRLIMGSNVQYAEHFGNDRPFQYFHLPTDLAMMRQIILGYFLNRPDLI